MNGGMMAVERRRGKRRGEQKHADTRM